MAFLKRYWKLIGAIWLVSLVIWGIPRLRNTWQLENRMGTLLKGIEARNARMYLGVVSESYADEWKFTSDQITRAFDDVSAQFLTLKIEPMAPVWTIGDTEATCEMTFKVSGKPVTPIGELILSEASSIKTPFRFKWRKEGWGAWTWKLIAVENTEIEPPSGYTPGAFSGRE